MGDDDFDKVVEGQYGAMEQVIGAEAYALQLDHGKAHLEALKREVEDKSHFAKAEAGKTESWAFLISTVGTLLWLWTIVAIILITLRVVKGW